METTLRYWGDSDSELLLSCYDTYLKPWVQDNWSSSIRWGTLPIRRNRSLSLSLKFVRFQGRKIYENSNGRKHDLSFLEIQLLDGEKTPNLILSILELIGSKKFLDNKFSFEGGFFMRGKSALVLKDKASDSIKSYFLKKGRINFFPIST